MQDTDDPRIEQLLTTAITQAVKAAVGAAREEWTEPVKLVLRIDEVASQIGLSPSTIRNFLNADSPWHSPDFPQPIRLGNGSGVRSAIGWRRADIVAWVNSRPAHEVTH